MSVARAEKRREAREKKLEDMFDRGVRHYRLHLGEKPPSLPRLPQTKEEMQKHLTGNHKDKFRDPVNREERRQWDRFWKMKGKGFTKSDKRRKK